MSEGTKARGTRRRTTRWSSRVALTAALAVGATVAVQPAVTPAAADTGSAACTESGISWVVDYTTAETGYGLVMTATDLTRIEDGVATDATTDTWELRWDHVPNAYPPAGSNPPSFNSAQGPLAPSGVERPIPDYLSPRFVTPDGICTVYLSPFTNYGAEPSTPSVAVLGDDLVHQLNDSDRNQTAFQGYVEASLTSLGVRSEIEGHVGARLSPATGPTGPAGANSHMADEAHGLLEHDIDGAVVALGMNDALYIAGGADEAARSARRDEVYASAVPVLTDLAARIGCVAFVTAPQNASSVDPDYAWAAEQVNNLVRYLVALGDGTDAAELVDFGAEATGHAPADPEPWFAPDGLQLTSQGKDAYTDALTRAALRCADSVVLWGAPGTLDDPFVSDRDTMPAGQAFATRAVEEWDFGPSKSPWFSTVTDDGTIFMMTGGTGGNVFAANGEGLQLAAFNPDDRTFEMVPIKTDRDVELPQAPCPTDGLGGASWDWCNTDPNVEGELFTMGGWVGDVATLNGGDAVAFTGYQVYLYQDTVNEGQFPALGVVSRGADGTWQVAEGPDGSDPDTLPDWRNSWSAQELYDATVAAADPSDPAAVAEAEALADSLCPANRTDEVNQIQVRDCGPWVNEIAVLPQSGDVVVAHYGTGKISVIDLSDPDAAGRVTARIAAVYDLPDIHDPAHPDDPSKMVTPAPREVQADPSSVLGDERFALTSDFALGLIEFRYDANATDPADRLSPVSAPVVSGETRTPPGASVDSYLGYGQFHYDHAGNLWVPTSAGGEGRGVKVYAKTASGRKITSPECLEVDGGGQPLPLEQYVAAKPGTTPIWGKECLPDFNISQPRILGPTYGIEEDPATHDIVLTDWAHGITTVVDPEGSGPGMTFRVGNVVDPMVKKTTSEEVSGPSWVQPVDDDPDDDVVPPHRPTGPTDQPDTTASAPPNIKEMQGPVDASGRLWMPVMQNLPTGLSVDSPELHMQPLDQWIYSIDISRLLGREPTQLTVRSGQATVVQAEQTRSMETTQAPGTSAAVEVTSTTPVRPCLDRLVPFGTGSWPIGCTDPVTGITGGGFSLGADTDPDGNRSEPVPAGTVAEYRIVVPKAGTYDITYRATDRGAAGVQNLDLTVNGTTYITEITSTGTPPYAAMTDHPMSTPVTLPAGVHTVQVAAPQGGWELDWIEFARS